VIQVQNLTRYYGNIPAVQDVNFEVQKGEILGFLGPNGAGKTTTMRIITGYMPATRGTVRVAGYDVFEEPLEVKKRIGYLPENPPLYPDMTVRDYLDFVAKIKQVDPEVRDRRVEETMERVRIRDRADQLIRNLSKGLKQRVGLGQALIHDPEVLILDEPTIGLDPKQIIEVRELIKDLGGDHTIILSTHILPEVSMTCERVVIINKGKVVAEDTPENLTARLKGSERLAVEVEGPKDEVQARLSEIDGVTNVTVESASNGRAIFTVESKLDKDVRKDLARTIVTNGWDLYELRPLGLSLEEVFLQLTTEEEEV
jgi:ABC-2 type transport system ATP-binding protein